MIYSRKRCSFVKKWCMHRSRKKNWFIYQNHKLWACMFFIAAVLLGLWGFLVTIHCSWLKGFCMRTHPILRRNIKAFFILLVNNFGQNQNNIPSHFWELLQNSAKYVYNDHFSRKFCNILQNIFFTKNFRKTDLNVI